MSKLRSISFWFPGRQDGRDVEALGEAGQWVAAEYSDSLFRQGVESRMSLVQVALRSSQGPEMVLDVLDFRGDGYDSAVLDVPAGVAELSLLDRQLLALDALVRLGEFMGDMRGWPSDAVTAAADHVRSRLLVGEPDRSASVRPRVVLAPSEPRPEDPWVTFGGLVPGPEVAVWYHDPYDLLAEVAYRVIEAYAATTMVEGRVWIRTLGCEALSVELVLSVTEKSLGRTTSLLHRFPDRRDLISELWLDPQRLQAMDDLELPLFLLEAVDAHVAAVAIRRRKPKAPRPGHHARQLLVSTPFVGPTWNLLHPPR